MMVIKVVTVREAIDRLFSMALKAEEVADRGVFSGGTSAQTAEKYLDRAAECEQLVSEGCVDEARQRLMGYGFTFPG